MFNSEEINNSQSRYDRWQKLSAEEINKLPIEDRLYILDKVEKNGKEQLKKQRQAEFNSIKQRRLSKELENTFIAIATICGALTFSLAPQLLGTHAGRGNLAISAGIFGGGAASFFAHHSASKVLTDLKLKSSTKKVYQSLVEQENVENV